MLNLIRISLAITIIGISILLSLLLMPAERFSGNLEGYLINSKIIVEGQVAEERNTGELKIFTIDGMEIVCECSGAYNNRNVRVHGVVREFNGKRQVNVLKINILD